MLYSFPQWSFFSPILLSDLMQQLFSALPFLSSDQSLVFHFDIQITWSVSVFPLPRGK